MQSGSIRGGRDNYLTSFGAKSGCEWARPYGPVFMSEAIFNGAYRETITEVIKEVSVPTPTAPSTCTIIASREYDKFAYVPYVASIPGENLLFVLIQHRILTPGNDIALGSAGFRATYNEEREWLNVYVKNPTQDRYSNPSSAPILAFYK